MLNPMFAEKKSTQDAGDFWREYEEKTGEKVLARSLGQYISGWEEFDKYGESPLWGLVIVSAGGFRFHHFFQQNWLSAMFRAGNADREPQEKTFFIPREQIISAELREETKWWKKFLSPALPELLIHYRAPDGAELKLRIQIEQKAEGLVENLSRKSLSEESLPRKDIS